MTRLLRAAAMAVIGLAFTSATAHAFLTCPFEHPRSAKQFRSALVQPMIPCNTPGGNTPNTTTEGGVPACQPVEWDNQLDGYPENGWLWGPPTYASITLKAGKNKLLGPLNPYPNSANLYVTLKIYHVFDDHGIAANAPGKLFLYLRATMRDRTGGNMTTVDFPVEFDFTLLGSDVALKTTVNAQLNADGKPSLPDCSSIEVLGVEVLDENGNRFATDGVYLEKSS